MLGKPRKIDYFWTSKSILYMNSPIKMNTTPYTVPAQFREPLIRPRRVPGEDYEQTIRLYLDEFKRRLALVPPSPPSPFQDADDDDDDDDEYLNDASTDEVDDGDYWSDEGTDEYDDDHPRHFEENPMKSVNYALKSVPVAELYEKMPDDCCFCMEEVSRAESVTTNCGHSFCGSCFANYRKRTCPCCRQHVDRLTTYYAYRSVDDDKQEL